MATQTLQATDLAFGRAVLLVTDSLGMSAEGAFWLYDGRDKEWRYFLITSLFGQVETSEIYLRLNEAMNKKLSERESEDFMIYITSPKEHMAKVIRSQVSTTRYASEPISKSIKIGGRSEKAWIYRMAPVLRQKETKLARHRFSRLSRELIAA
jgi:hypothetical protein